MSEPTSSKGAFIFAFAVLALIIFSTVTYLLETLMRFYKPRGGFDGWDYFEAVSIAVFTVELGARFSTCPNRRAFVTDGLHIVRNSRTTSTSAALFVCAVLHERMPFSCRLARWCLYVD